MIDIYIIITIICIRRVLTPKQFTEKFHLYIGRTISTCSSVGFVRTGAELVLET